MSTKTDRTPGAGVGMLCVVALVAWLGLAWPVRAQVAPPPPQEAADDEAPRKDVRMGNTDNMRMGRDAAGNVVMEVRPPQKDPASQPPVGPFYIYPQVRTPWSQSGGQGGQAGGQSGQSRPTPTTSTGAGS
jgi:hypothetical protein